MSTEKNTDLTVGHPFLAIAKTIHKHFVSQYGKLHSPSFANLMIILTLNVPEESLFQHGTEALKAICNCLKKNAVSVTAYVKVNIDVEFVVDYDIKKRVNQNGLENIKTYNIPEIYDEFASITYLQVTGSSWYDCMNVGKYAGPAGLTGSTFISKYFHYRDYEMTSDGQPLWHKWQDAYFKVHELV